MNHVYRIIWNEITRCWVAVAETVKSCGKRSHSAVGAGRGQQHSERSVLAKNLLPPILKILAASVSMIGIPVWALDTAALPTGGKVTAGSAAVSQVGTTLKIQQNTQRAALDWQSFNIGAAATVNFAQPNSSAVVLNRIVGNDASQIYGKLNANGQVFFSNPNGILFAKGAQVNVGGLLATTLRLGNEDFMAGNYRFSNPGTGTVRNEGIINALGSVALLGATVQNAGQIIATTVTLAAGNTVAVDLTGDGLIRARVIDPALKASVENTSSIEATAAVTLTAGQAQGTLNQVVNNSGLIRATGFTLKGGEIVLEGGSTTNAGTLDASSNAGRGGTVKVLGTEVSLLGTSRIDASGATGGGTVLVGGDFQGKNPDVRNAKLTYVGPIASIKADATAYGDGGKVVVWADDSTQFNGNISARGGAKSGNGGQVEVSGKQTLTYNGLTNTLAAHGQTGSLLLDPADFIIAATGSDITGATLSNQVGLANTTITTALTGGTVGLVNTGTLGNITVNDTVTWANANTLTLNAYGNIAINSPITAALGGLVLNAGGSGAAGATIIQSASANLTLASMNANANGGTTLAASNTIGSLDVQSGGVTSSGTLNLSGTLANATLKAATLTSSSGTLSNVTIGSSMTESGPLNISNNLLLGNGVDFNTGASSLYFNSAASTIGLASGATAATLTKAGGQMYANGSNNSGVVTINSGVTVQGYGSLASYYNPGGGWVNNGTLNANVAAQTLTVNPTNFTNSGTINVASGATVTRAAGFTNSGILSGSGTIAVGTGSAKLINQGNINPGSANTAGTLTIAGDVLLDTASILNVRLGGTTAGQSDKLAVTGNLTTGGTLVASKLVGYTPANADAIPFLTATGAIAGSNFTLPTVPSGFSVGYNLNPGEAARLIYASGSTTKTFTNGATTLAWDNPLNWSGGALPGAADGALISSGVAVTHSTGTDAIAALTINSSNALNVSGGSLTVSGATTLGGTLTVSGTGAATLNGALSGGTTGQVAVSAGNLSLNAASTIKDLTLSGGTLGGTGTVTVGNSFTRTSGAFGNGLTGLNITQASGDLSPGAINISGPVALTASAGNITTSGITTTGNLTLNATGTINATGAVTTAGTFTLGSGTWTQVASTLPGFSASDFRIAGGTFIRALAGDGSTATPYQLADIYGVQSMGSSGSLGKSFALANNVDASSTSTWNSGTGFMPIGNSASRFTGNFNGLGHTVTSLTINRPGVADQGLFGALGTGSRVENVGLVGGSTTGLYNVGALVGESNGANVINSYATGNVTASGSGPNFLGVALANAGGLVGSGINGASIQDSYATGSITGSSAVGGLVGSISTNSTVMRSHASGAVTSPTASTQFTGGLVGLSDYAGGEVVSDSYATGAVSGQYGNIGGLVGWNGGSIFRSFATGNVSAPATGSIAVGGLAGYNRGFQAAGTVDSYATGSVIGADSVGGLIGYNEGPVVRSYSSGSVTGVTFVGGLIGQYLTGAISNSFWDAQTSGQASSGGGTGLTTAQMKQFASFSSWNNTTPNTIANTGASGAVWRIYEGNTNPLLRNFLTPVTLADSPDAIATYNGTARSGATSANVNVWGAAATGTNAGFYNGYYSTQQGYDISGGNLTINALAVTVANLAGNKVYDGNTSFVTGQLGISNVVSGDTLSLTAGTANTADKTVGVNKPLTSFTGLALGGTSAGNYTLTGVSGVGTITQRALAVTATGSNRVYDGGTLDAVTLADNRVAGDVLVISNTANFADKNVGNAKAVNVSGIAVSGTDAGNYTANSSATTSANITARALTVSASGSNRVYDGSTVDAVSLADNRVAGDLLSITNTAANFADKNVGNAKAVNVSGIAVSGTDAGNYSLSTTTATGLGTISQLTSVNWTGSRSSGDFYTAANWAGGAIPDKNNVAAIVFPSGLNYTSTTPIVLGNTALSSTGNLALDVTGGFTSGAGAITVSGGGLGLTVHSPITIGSGGIQTSTGVQLVASTPSGGSTIDINGPVASATGPVGITAYGNVSQTAAISGGSISLTSTAGNISMASTATNTVPAGGTIQVSAPAGTIASAAANFSGATPTLSSSVALAAPTTTTVITTAAIAQAALATLPMLQTLTSPVVQAPAVSPFEPIVSTPAEPSPAVTLETTSSSAPANASEDKAEGKPTVKPTIQLVTVANSKVQKPAEQIVQADRPKGQVLSCRR